MSPPSSIGTCCYCAHPLYATGPLANVGSLHAHIACRVAIQRTSTACGGCPSRRSTTCDTCPELSPAHRSL